MRGLRTAQRRSRLLPLIAIGALALTACQGDDTAIDDDPAIGAGLDEGLDEEVTGPADDGTDDELDGDDEQDGDDELDGDDEQDDDELDGDDEVDADFEGIAFDQVVFDLQLAEVSVDEFSLDDDEPEFVTYTFTNTVQEIADETGFRLVGFNPENVIDASSVELLDDQISVLAEFEAGTDLFSYALGSVINGVVTTTDGEGNVQSSAALAGAGAVGQATALPELVNASIDADQQQIEYIFDEPLGEQADMDASAFGFYTTNGEAITGGEIVDADENVVVVSFEDDEALIEDAVRIFANRGAVTDGQGNENVATALGDTTAAPDPVDAAQAGETATQFEFTFDEAVSVTDAEPSAFTVVTADGERFEGEEVATVDADTLRVTFTSELEEFADQLTLAAVMSGAVPANDSEGIRNTAGSIVLEGAAVVGATGGPDLIDVELGEATGRVILTFDEDLDDEDMNAGGVILFTDAGMVIEAEEVVAVNENQLVVSFQEANAEAAVGVSVNNGAVQDDTGTPNPIATLPF